MEGISIDFDTKIIENLMAEPLFGLVISLVVSIFFIIVAFLIVRSILIKKNELRQTFKTRLLLVLLPQMSTDQKAGATSGESITLQQLQEKIALMESFLGSLAGLKAQKGFKSWLLGREDILSLELVASKGKISFYISTPIELQDLIEDQINAQFPSAVIEEVADYNIFAPESVVLGKLLTFKRQYFFPIKTYKKMDTDPLNALINSLGQVDDEDGVAIQIVFRSAHSLWHKMGSKVASEMQQGKKLEEAIKSAKKGGAGSSILKDAGQILTAKGKDDSAMTPKIYQLSPMEQELVKGLEEKTSKAGVDACIRIVACSKLKIKVEAYINNIVNAFSQYNIYQYGNAFKLSEKSPKNLIDDFIFRNFDEKNKVLLNSEELASLFHFPIPSYTSSPKVHWLEARRAPAPQELSPDGVIIGENVYRGVKKIIRFAKDDRRRHMYVIGKSGSGKSYFLTNIIIQDILNGEGVCVIDPHGDLVEDLLEYIPKERAEDVIFFNPADTERPMGMNMLEFERPEQKTFVINELMNILDKLYDLRSTGGPMFEQYFRNAVQLLMEDPASGMSIMEVPRVLADEDYRAYKLSKAKNPTVKNFWEKEAQKAGGEASLQNMVPYITSKLTQFTANDFMRPIISQQKSSFSFRKAMDEKKIIFCHLSKGKLGDMNSDLLGMIVIGKILGAALSRVDTPEDQRNDFYLYIDEFQNYLTEGISIILSEARKYKLCLNIAHQYVGQLVKNNDTRIRDSIFGNVGTVVAFRVGVDDAELFAKQFAPVFSEYDVINIPRFETYVKLLVRSQNPPAFNMRSIAREQKKNPELGQAIKELSRLKYGKDRNIIESEIRQRATQDYEIEEEEDEADDFEDDDDDDEVLQ